MEIARLCAKGLVVRLERIHAIGPMVQLELRRSESDELIEVVISQERLRHLQLQENESLVIRPRQMHIFLGKAAYYRRRLRLALSGRTAG